MTMNIKIFERNAELYGPNYSSWPDVDSKEIESFLEKNMQAKAILKEAQDLSSILESYHVPNLKADLPVLTLEKIDQSSEKKYNPHHISQNRVSNDPYYSSALRWVAVASFIVLLCGSNVWFVQGNGPLGLNQEMVTVSENQASDFLDGVLEGLIADEIEIEESIQLLAMLEGDNLVPLQADSPIPEQKEDTLIEEYLEEWEYQELDRVRDIWELFMGDSSRQGYKHGQNKIYS